MSLPVLILALGTAWVLMFAATRQAARRKGRTPAWGFAAIWCPAISLLVLELLPTYPSTARSNLVLEWVGSLIALAVLIGLFVQGALS